MPPMRRNTTQTDVKGKIRKISAGSFGVLVASAGGVNSPRNPAPTPVVSEHCELQSLGLSRANLRAGKGRWDL